MRDFDAIIVGAGSIGVPTALSLGRGGARVLVVDKNASPGQGENKHAIGGIRATHSSPAKILVGLHSLEVFSQWQEHYGDDIEWLMGGYLFPAYRDEEESALRAILPIQKEHGLDIDFIDPAAVVEVVNGITTEGLRGGTFSPGDGSASPLLAINAFYRQALENGVRFCFNEAIVRIDVEKGKVSGITTDKGQYRAPVVIDAAGGHSRDLCRTAGADVPVTPESHEGAITESVQPFFQAMVVDLRPGDGSKNYYFYQNRHGQVVFCITPDPPILGTDKRETARFLPQVCSRMVRLIPRLKNLRVRRVWRGLYPMSPDGTPIVGWNRDVEGLLHATGMCGQGFMLGPGIGEVVARLVLGQSTPDDGIVLDEFSPYRAFGTTEALK